MVSLFVDAAPILAPVILLTGLFVAASSAGLLWMGWRDALEIERRARRWGSRRRPGNGPLRAIDSQA